MNSLWCRCGRKFLVVLLAAAGAASAVDAMGNGGVVAAWGDNSFGQTNPPATLTNAVAIAAGGYHGLALLPNGRVTGWGDNGYGEASAPSTLTNATAIAAGLYHSMALRSNGTVAVWGNNNYGQGGQPSVPASATNVTAIACGWYHNLALRNDGTVVAWGAGVGQGIPPNYGQALVPTNLSGVTAIAAGAYHSLALLTNGTVVAWGLNSSGQTNVPPGLNNVVAIAAGGSNSIALLNNGAVVAWGANTAGQTNIPLGLTNFVAVSAGAAHDLALVSNGTVGAWGLNTSGQTNVPGTVTNVTAIAAGAYWSAAILNNGPVTFLSSLLSETVYQGGTATFSPALLGAAPLSYQWLWNGTNLPWGTNASLTIPGVQFTNAGSYQLVVSNSFGVATSSAATLTVLPPSPTFTFQPANVSILQNSNTAMSVIVVGSPPLTLQWQLNGAAISGATNTLLTITNAQPANQGYYSVVASNAYGTTVSSNGFLDVIDVPQALNATNLVWFNSSQPPWFAESGFTHDGVAAAAAGPLSAPPPQPGQQSTLQTTVTGPGTLSFWWAVSNNITFQISVDGSLSGNFSQHSPVWTNSAFYLSAGSHALTWMAENQELDAPPGMAWLDQVGFTVGATLPAITSQPASQTNAAGTSPTFGVGAIGTPPFSYQWFFNGVSLAGATMATLPLSNIQTSNAGTYMVVITNIAGVAVSSNATLTVTPSAPSFTLQPAGASILLGQSATFSGAALGSSPIFYQWLWNGAPLAGATGPSLTINNVQYTNGGSYSLQASNVVGVAVSSNAMLAPYSFADLGAALNSPSIAWSTTNVPWFPETNITYNSAEAAQSGVIANAQESTLQGNLSGPATITYWWQVDCDSFWVNLAFFLNGTAQNAIAGTTSWQQATNYIGAGPQTLQWNLYPIHGVFAGGTGWVSQVQVTPGGTSPFLKANPASSTTSAGNTVAFSVSALGTPPLVYQWQFNGASLPGATNTALTLNNVQTNNSGIYNVVITNGYGVVMSSNATLAVNPSAPDITAQPANQHGVVSGSASFSVTAIGSSPLSYLWQFGGTPIPGATLPSLSLTNLQLSNSGNYTVVVTNPVGSVTSSVAVLEVDPMVVIEYWPQGFSAYAAPLGLSNITSIAVGNGHTLALRQDGTVLAWGLNNEGLTNVPSGLSNVMSIASGAYHAVALQSNGAVVVWGDNTYGQLTIPAGVSNIVAIAAASYDTLALRNDGAVLGWGANGNGQLNIPAGLTNLQTLAAGPFNGFALSSNGALAQWGSGPVWQHNGTNTQLVVADGNNLTAVAAGAYSAWTLDCGSQVEGWGWDGPLEDFGVAALAAAGNGQGGDPDYDYALALDYNGGAYLEWPAPLEEFDLPYIPSSPANVVAVAAAYGHAAVLVNDGSPRVVGPAIHASFYSSSNLVLAPGIVGAAPMSFQWQFNGTNLAGATNGILVITNVPLTAAGAYQCIGGNNLGQVTNQSVAVTVLRSAPSFAGIQWVTGLGLSLELQQLSGHGPVVVYASSNLVNWQAILTNPPVTGSLQVLDASALPAPVRFYRAAEE